MKYMIICIILLTVGCSGSTAPASVACPPGYSYPLDDDASSPRVFDAMRSRIASMRANAPNADVVRFLDYKLAQLNYNFRH